MMKCVAVLLTVGLMGMAGNARAAGTDMSLQLTRYDQMIDRLMKQNEQLMGDMRQLQRDNLTLKKTVDEAQSRAQGVSDDMQRLQNMTMSNLTVQQRQLLDKVNDLQRDTDSQGRKIVWGDGTRDCPTVKAKHQQIKVDISPDGGRSVKFLCYDGKPLHLNTELHDLGQ